MSITTFIINSPVDICIHESQINVLRERKTYNSFINCIEQNQYIGHKENFIPHKLFLILNPLLSSLSSSQNRQRNSCVAGWCRCRSRSFGLSHYCTHGAAATRVAQTIFFISILV